MGNCVQNMLTIKVSATSVIAIVALKTISLISNDNKKEATGFHRLSLFTTPLKVIAL